MSRSLIACLMIVVCIVPSLVNAHPYQRNKAVPVEKVLFGSIDSTKLLTQQEIHIDKNNGWHRLGGALIGGAIGNQFGDGSGQVAATILGSIIGSNMSNNRTQNRHIVHHQLVELLITTEQDGQFMVIQDYDPHMIFNTGDKVRLVYLANGFVRVDIAY